MMNNMKDVSEHCTFSGQEATPLDMATLVKAIDTLSQITIEPPLIQRISHNCGHEEFFRVFGIGKENVSERATDYFGLPVYIHRWIPRGEVWLQDKNGKVIKKFSISKGSPNAS